MARKKARKTTKKAARKTTKRTVAKKAPKRRRSPVDIRKHEGLQLSVLEAEKDYQAAKKVYRAAGETLRNMHEGLGWSKAYHKKYAKKAKRTTKRR